MIIKSKDKRVYLKDLEDKFKKKKNSIYSLMQWSDAKEFFRRGSYCCGIAYSLHPIYAVLNAGEIVKKINDFYGLYQD